MIVEWEFCHASNLHASVRIICICGDGLGTFRTVFLTMETTMFFLPVARCTVVGLLIDDVIDVVDLHFLVVLGHMSSSCVVHHSSAALSCCTRPETDVNR